jgi:ATP-dependent helicase HrpA
MVLGEYQSPGRFEEHNRQLQAEVEQLEHKARRKDLLADEQARFAFYDQRLPAEVFDGVSFEKWREQAERESPKLLFMQREDLQVDDAAQVSPEYYPDNRQLGQAVLPLDYLAEPGHAADGVTITVPLELLEQMPDEQLAWLVPGMLREKVIMLIRSLPKAIRRHFVPVPDWADRVVGRLDRQQGPLLHALAGVLGRLAGITVDPDAFDTGQLPEHLRMNIRVIDAKNAPIAEGRDLGELRRRLADQLRQRFQSLEHPQWNRRDIRRWDFGSIPSKLVLDEAGLGVTGYPMLVDSGRSVRMQLAESAEKAQRHTRRAIARLFALETEAEIDFHLTDLFDTDRLALLYSPIGSPKQMYDQVRLLIADRAFMGDGQPPNDAEQFEAALNQGWNQLRSVVQQVGGVIDQLLSAYSRTVASIEQANGRGWAGALGDMKQQVGQLVAGRFIIDTPFAWLCQFPRYFQAIDRRVAKLQHGRSASDAKDMAEVQRLWNQYAQRAEAHAQRGLVDPHLVAYRWMLEEYRVHLFAQDLGTAVPVSGKRLAEQWRNVSG